MDVTIIFIVREVFEMVTDADQLGVPYPGDELRRLRGYDSAVLSRVDRVDM